MGILDQFLPKNAKLVIFGTKTPTVLNIWVLDVSVNGVFLIEFDDSWRIQ